MAFGDRPTDWYHVLKVKRSATQKEIRDAFYQQSLKCHPDCNPGNKKAEKRFKRINDAYQVLSKPDKRQELDDLLKGARTGSAGLVWDGGFGYVNPSNDAGQFYQIDPIETLLHAYLSARSAAERDLQVNPHTQATQQSIDCLFPSINQSQSSICNSFLEVVCGIIDQTKDYETIMKYRLEARIINNDLDRFLILGLAVIGVSAFCGLIPFALSVGGLGKVAYDKYCQGEKYLEAACEKFGELSQSCLPKLEEVAAMYKGRLGDVHIRF